MRSKKVLFRGMSWVSLSLIASGCGGGAERAAQPEQPAVDSSGEDLPETQESFPEHEDLADPERREAAVERLIDEYERVTATGTKTEPARAFVRAHGKALVRAYIDGHDQLSAKSRLLLLNLLVSFDDPVTAPALALAIQHYAKTSEGVEEAVWAAQAAKKQRSDDLAKALMSAFGAVDMSDKEGRRFSQHLEQAMVFNATPAWTQVLRDRLRQPIVRPERFDDKEGVRAFNNQRFWQLTAAKLLGTLGDSDSARTLLKVTLDPEKGDIHAEAARAYAKLGKAAVALATELLRRTDDGLVQAAQAYRPDDKEAHLVVAAKWLEELAHPSSREPLIAAWEQSQTPEAQVLLARALTRMPADERSVEIVKLTYSRTRSQTTLPDGEGALESLARSSVYFFDSALAEWLGDQIARVPGKGARRADVQRTLVFAASELMTEEQIKKLRTPAQKYGGRTGTPAYEAAAELARRCGNKVDCYAAAISESGSQTDGRADLAVKAATMVGALGQKEQRDALLIQLPKVTHPDVAQRVAEVIAHLTPEYDAAVVKALEERIKGENNPTLVVAFERALHRVQARR